MGRGSDGARTPRRALLAAALAAGGCASAPPLPVDLPPAHAVALPAALSTETIAVLDFEDARPEFERSEAALDEHFIGGRFLANDRFWWFHPLGGDLPQDPALPPDVRARVTGTAAFSWYPFPNHGIGKPLPAPVALGLSDYIALHLEQRGIFGRVVRARDPEQARAARATLLLTGRVDRFGAMFTEVKDPFAVRSDDPRDWRIVAASDYKVELRKAEDGALVLARECLGRDEDDHIFDELAHFRGSGAVANYRLSQSKMANFAASDLASHSRRSLERATVPLIAAVEAKMRESPGAQ
jgi:hypothetical protein